MLLMKINIITPFLLIFLLFSCTDKDQEGSLSALSPNIFSSKNPHQLLQQLLEKQSLKKGRICWIGDSITEQGIAGHGNDIGFTTIIEEQYPDIDYTYSAVGGHTTEDVLSRLDLTLSFDADLYIVAIGINDVRKSTGANSFDQYLTNIIKIVDSIKRTGAEVAVLSIFPSFWSDQNSVLSYNETQATIDLWNSGLKMISEFKGFIYVDATTVIRQKVNYRNLSSLVSDGVHPNYNEVEGKRLYANAILFGDSSSDKFGSEQVLIGKHFYKLVILDNGKSDYVGVKNLTADVELYDLLAFARAPTFTDSSKLLLEYESSYFGLLNQSGDAPLVLFFSAETAIQELVASGQVGFANRERGIRSYKLYYSSSPSAHGREDDASWKLVAYENSNVANAVSLLPNIRPNIFYQLRIFDAKNGADKIKISRIGASAPIRVWQQNLLMESERNFGKVFSSGSDLYPLIASNVNVAIQWEATEELSELDLQSLDDSIGNWKLYLSHDSQALSSTGHASWVELASGFGQNFLIIPE